MKLMLTFSVSAERGNAAAQDGTLGKAIDGLIKATSAEASYFTLIDGQRGGVIVFDAADPAILPKIVEPMFAALVAAIEAVPALTLDAAKCGLIG